MSEPIDLNYRPRGWQKQFHDGVIDKRFAVAIVARQHGKTEAACQEIIHRALTGPEGAAYALVAPYAVQSTRIFWPRLKRLLEPLTRARLVTFSETNKIVTLAGNRRIHCLGCDTESARGLSFRGLVADEYDSLDISIWNSVFLPTLTDAGDDSFVLYIGTLSSAGRLWQLYQDKADDPEWYTQMTRASEAGIMTPDQMERYRTNMGEYAFLREFECDPSPPVAHTVLGDLMEQARREGRITKVPYDADRAVICSWDLGIADSTSIWFCQFYGNQLHMIDYEEYAGIGLDEIIRRIQAKPYNISLQILPHDVQVRDYGTGSARLDLFYAADLDPQPLQRAVVADTLTAARVNLQRTLFDAENCRRGIEALRQASFQVEQRTQTVINKVKHDHHSHGLDSFRYLCQWVQENYPLDGANTADFEVHNTEYSDAPLSPRDYGIDSDSWAPSPHYFE